MLQHYWIDLNLDENCPSGISRTS